MLPLISMLSHILFVPKAANPPKRVCHWRKTLLMLIFSFGICARRRNPADQDPKGREFPVREFPGKEGRHHRESWAHSIEYHTER